MARTYLVFGDIEGKLDVLRVECTKCPRNGRYSVHNLIEKYGRMGKLGKETMAMMTDGKNRIMIFGPKAMAPTSSNFGRP
jgi:hypothetical protein